MTTLHSSQFPSNPDGAAPAVVRLSDPGSLISAVPALLGFHPHRSLVALCLVGASVGAVMRHDIVLGDEGCPAPVMEVVLEQFAAVAVREGADRMLAVMVDDRIPARARAADLGRHRVIVDRFRELLWRSGIDLGATHVCARIAAGMPWRDLGGGQCGVLPDPAASAVAVAQVVGGRAIRGSRGELEAVLAPAPVHVQARIADLIDAAREEGTGAAALAQVAADRARADRVRLETVLARIAEFDSGDEMSEPACAEMALALESLTVRDAVVALSMGEHADAAEQMWIHLGRYLPDPERAEPLALLGYSAYVRGDGPMAGVALCAALAADPCHSLAGLLDGALQAGMRPHALRDLAVVGHEIARDIGVELPPLGALPLRGV